MLVCAFVNAPSNNALFQQSDTTAYKIKLDEMTNEMRSTGIFGPESRGTWRFGRYRSEPYHEEFIGFIHRIMEYAVKKVVANVPTIAGGHVIRQGLQHDKVEEGWLTNAGWNQYRPAGRMIPDSEDSTAIISNAYASSTIPDTASTTVPNTVVYQESTDSEDIVKGETANPK